MQSTFLRIVALLIPMFVYGNKHCSNSRVAPRYRDKFERMNDGDLLVEARYRVKRARFQVIRLWNDDGESMSLNDQIQVNSNGACFNELSNDRYLLAVRKGPNGYTPLLPPLSIKKASKRHEIWTSWCSISPDHCGLSITRVGFPSLKVFDRNQLVIVNCYVSSEVPIKSISWLKDQISIDDGYTYADSDMFVNDVNLDDGKSQMIIARASDKHVGIYACVATDVNDDKVELQSKFVLRGDRRPLISCPSGKENYCLSGSTCYGIRGIPNEAACLCPRGFEGDRCHIKEIDSLLIQEQYSNPEEEIDRLENTIVILSIGTILAGVGFIVVLAMLCRSRRRRSRDYESPVDIDKTADTDIESASDNLNKV